MGSTSYDEARDATDPRWAGASWYGPTTGEYWIVNPREYADPRKHGPGYSGRVRSGDLPPSDPPIDEPPTWAEAGPAPTADDAAFEGGQTADEAFRQARATSARDAREAAWVRAAGARTAGARTAGVRAASAAPEPLTEEPRRGERFLDALTQPGPADPLRRLGLVLLGWAPIGIAAAAIIGQATGCDSYSVACEGTDPFLPWVVQAVIVGLLLLAPPLARVFAAATIGLVIGLLPATAFVIAFGGNGSPAAPPFVVGTLALSWLLGAAWSLRRMALARAADAARAAGGAP